MIWDRLPHPKGMGYASSRASVDGIQKQSHHGFILSRDQNNCESASDYQKILLINLSGKHEKMGEGSLQPQPKGWGIRDPPRSLCIKKDSGKWCLISH